jgi:AcrR family transcriptional regulator
MARTRAFDLETATDQALRLFWTQGYEGTTLDDLTAAMGINRPSLYAAFGSKEALFERALERYLQGPAAGAFAGLENLSARDGVLSLMRFYADAAGIADRPAGCLLVNGALVCSDESRNVRAMLADRRHFGEAALVRFLERAKKKGELGSDDKPADLARFVWAVCHGLTVQAVGGATRAQLRKVVDLAIRAWPSA